MRIPLFILAAGLIIASLGGSRLHVALEDRGDPNPRQMMIKATSLGLGAALIVSWTAR